MSTVVPERGKLTDWLVEQLAAALAPRVLVGDGIAPQGSGWGGEPGASGRRFVSYVTVGTGEATPAETDPIRSRHWAWLCGYQLAGIGASREQADWTGDQVRAACVGLANTDLDLGAPWKLQAVLFTRLGPVSRFDRADPPYWRVTDTVQLRISREREL